MGRNLVPVWWTADEEGALPELDPCPQTTAALVVAERSCRRPESPLLNFHNVTDIGRAALTKNGVHHGRDLEFNSYLYRQPVKTL